MALCHRWHHRCPQSCRFCFWFKGGGWGRWHVEGKGVCWESEAWKDVVEQLSNQIAIYMLCHPTCMLWELLSSAEVHFQSLWSFCSSLRGWDLANEHCGIHSIVVASVDEASMEGWRLVVSTSSLKVKEVCNIWRQLECPTNFGVNVCTIIAWSVTTILPSGQILPLQIMSWFLRFGD